MKAPDARRIRPRQEADSQSISVATKSDLIVRRATVRIGTETIELAGPCIFETLRPARFRPIYVGGLGWVLDRRKRGRDRLPDLLAVLDAAGYRVTVVDGGGC